MSEPSIEELIERSSLGTPEAKRIRESADPALVERVMDRLRCACVWRGERCPNLATQEDGLCNWCGNGRMPEQMRDDPKALIAPDGTFMGIGGGGQLHDFDQAKPASTAACWYPDSDRTVQP